MVFLVAHDELSMCLDTNCKIANFQPLTSNWITFYSDGASSKVKEIVELFQVTKKARRNTFSIISSLLLLTHLWNCSGAVFCRLIKSLTAFYQYWGFWKKWICFKFFGHSVFNASLDVEMGRMAQTTVCPFSGGSYKCWRWRGTVDDSQTKRARHFKKSSISPIRLYFILEVAEWTQSLEVSVAFVYPGCTWHLIATLSRQLDLFMFTISQSRW